MPHLEQEFAVEREARAPQLVMDPLTVSTVRP
jgi:hypothetical protein